MPMLAADLSMATLPNDSSRSVQTSGLRVVQVCTAMAAGPKLLAERRAIASSVARFTRADHQLLHDVRKVAAALVRRCHVLCVRELWAADSADAQPALHAANGTGHDGCGTMSVLVTGGAGYIGSHMVLALLDAGERVVVLDNLSTGFRWAVPPSAPLIVGDVGDEGLLRTILRRHAIEAILHFAGSIVVPESIADPLGYYHNNTVKSRALIAAAVEAGVAHFIFSSTAAVYGNAAIVPVPEHAPLAPMSPYGVSKMMTEMMLADTARAHPLKYVALRYFNVAGADPDGRSGQSTPRATHLIKVASEAAIGKRPYMEVFGTDYPTPDGTCVRDYIHVSDLARAHMAALGHLRGGGTSDVFNCGYAEGYSVLQVIEAVQRASGSSFEVRLAPRRPGDPAQLVADSSRIRSHLAWQPELADLDRIAAHALAWEARLAAGVQLPKTCGEARPT